MRTKTTGADGSFNLGRISDPKLDALIDALKTETDAKKRDGILREALVVTRDNYYYVPLHHQLRPWAMKNERHARCTRRTTRPNRASRGSTDAGEVRPIGAPQSAGWLRRAWDHDLAWSFRRSPVTIVAALLTLVCVGGALFAPWIAPHNPFDSATLNLSDGFTPPAWTDKGGNPSTCSAPTTRAATCSRRSCTARASRSASGSPPCCSRWCSA